MIDYFLKSVLTFLINRSAEQYKVDPHYVAAIVYQESARGSSSLLDAISAFRYEPLFDQNLIQGKPLTGYVPKKNESAERRVRACSFGLMQIMLATAREHGFTADYAPALIFPWINIDVGTRYFARLLAQENGDYENALRRYNGSKNNPQTLVYAHEVKGHVASGAFKAVYLL